MTHEQGLDRPTAASPLPGIRRLTGLLLFLALVGWATVLGWGEKTSAPGSDAIDEFVKHQMQERKIPSVALAVIKNGVIVKQGAYGYARLESLLLAAPSTRYRLDSLTKQFTAAAILLLQQQGQLRIDEPVDSYLPDAPANWKQITLRDLLTHTAGFPRDSPAGYSEVADQARSMRSLLSRLYQMRPLTRPGTHYQYSNAGYGVLGAIVEKVSGQSYAQFLQQYIFAPAAMNDTRVDNGDYSDLRLALGYNWDPSTQRWQARNQGHSALAAGSVQSTVLDLAKWEASLEKDTILTAESKKQMWSPLVLKNGDEYDYGLGWFVQDCQAGRLISHGGSGWGYSTAFYRYPDAGYAVIVLTNSQPSRDNHHASILARGIAALYDPLLREPAHRVQVRRAASAGGR
jgi:CubicO group peptidase (beta-lactamase class C family)